MKHTVMVYPEGSKGQPIKTETLDHIPQRGEKYRGAYITSTQTQLSADVGYPSFTAIWIDTDTYWLDNAT